MEGEITVMEALITNVTSLVTAGLGWMGDVVGEITTAGNELILIFVLLPLVGLGIGFLKRLIG